MNTAQMPAETVTVYYFQTFDPDTQQAVVSTFKSTRTDIERKFEGTVLEGTAETVSPSELDHEYRYRRVATGWGALD